MPFSQTVAAEVLVRCARRCCICRRFCGTKMHLHHIVPEAEGGEDSADNCIPLCFDCHEEVGAYNDNHPIGRKFTASELKQHRDIWFDFVKSHPERVGFSTETLFRRLPEALPPSPETLARVEPLYHEANIWTRAKGNHRAEVFAARVRNLGTRSIYVEVIGLAAGERRYPAIFSLYPPLPDDERTREIPPSKSQVFSWFGNKIPIEDLSKIDGMYVITGTGNEFVNKNVDLTRLIQESKSNDLEGPPVFSVFSRTSRSDPFD